MAILYDFYQNPHKKGEEADFHIRLNGSKTVSTAEVKEHIQNACSLTSADVSACLSALADIIQSSFEQGNRVKLDELGTFSPLLEGQVRRNEKGNFVLKNGKVKGVAFRAESGLIRRLYNIPLICANRSKSIVKVPTDEEIIVALKVHFAQSDHISGKMFVQLTGLPRSSSYKVLHRLLEHNVLEKESYGVYVKRNL